MYTLANLKIQRFNSQKKGGNMRKTPPEPNFPRTNNVVLAIKLDTKKKTERAIICESNELTSIVYFEMKKDRVICEDIRPIISLLTEISTTQIRQLKSIESLILEDSTKSNKRQNFRSQIIKKLEDLYNKENFVSKYVALKIWEFYRTILENRVDPASPVTIQDKLEDLIYPFQSNIINKIFEPQKYSDNYKWPFSPFRADSYEDLKYPIKMIYLPKFTRNMKRYYDIEQCVFTDMSISSLVLYYKKVIYEEQKFLRYCKVCGKLFLASDASKTTICSNNCRKKQIEENRTNYKEKHEHDPTEKTYNNDKAYWRYRISKAKTLNADEYAIAELTQAFSAHKKSALKMKHQVQDGEIDFAVFNGWILKARNTIDSLMEKYNL